MEAIFRFFASRHTLAMVITLMIIILGIGTFFTIQKDVFPVVEFGELIITTRFPGAAPEDVELNVTNPIEEEIREVSGIDRVTSYSMENISVIDVMVDPNAKDTDEIVSEVREAVNRVTDLPAEVTERPDVSEINTSEFPVIEVGLSGDLPYRELREAARLFEKKLENVSGVSRVDKFGYREREIKVEIDPQKVNRLQVPLRAVISAIASRNIRSTGGSFESYTSEKNVVTLAQFEEPSDVGDVIVRASFDGPAIKVSDLAEIKDDFEEERVTSRMNGEFAISFLVFKKETADAIRTIDGIKALVDEEREFFPAGVQVGYSDDYSRYIRNRMSVVVNNGAIGLGLVVLLLGAFLSVRSAFWVAMGIPVALFGTLFLLPLFDSMLDVITMAAMIMVIGIVVDDAIIVAENIHRKRELGMAPLDAAVKGLSEVFKPVVTTILTTFVAFAPMFFMSGIMGKFVFVIPLTITLALAITLLESTIALPAHVIFGLEEKGGPATKVARGWFRHVRDFYRRTSYYVFKARYAVLLISLGTLGGGLWYATHKMDFVLFPSSAADTFFIRMELPRGTSLQATADKIREVEQLVEELPDGEVDSYVTRIGNQGNFVLGENENWAMISVFLAPFADRDRNAEEIVDELRSQTDSLEGYDNLLYYIDGGGPPVGSPITMRIVGSDDRVRTALADTVVAFMRTIPGVTDIDRNDKLGKDQIEIDIDYEKLSRLGLTVADVARNVRIALDGELVTSVRYGDEDVEFRVLFNERARGDSQLLSKLLVPNDRNRLIPLGEVARLRSGPGDASVYHYDGDRAVMVTADVTKGVITPLEATQMVERNFDLARDWRGMRFVVGGEAEETAESMQSLIRAFASAAVGIYFLLVLLFNSLLQPLMVMSAIPLGVIGVIIVFALHGEPLGFLAMMGLIGLSGVVVNDSLVLVNYINHLRQERAGERLLEIVTDGAADRLRAILLTTLTTVAGLLPLAYGIGGSDPFIAPMALAMGFGLLFASPITLALVPSLYLIVEDFQRLGRWAVRGIGRRRTAESSAGAEPQPDSGGLETSPDEPGRGAIGN